MSRKAKGTELNERQILEMQAYYESGKYSNVKIAKLIAEEHNIIIGESTVRFYRDKEGWIKGKEKEYYDAKKITKEKEILAQFKTDDKEAQRLDKISTEAEKHAQEIAEAKLEIEARQVRIKAQGHRLLEEYLDELLDVRKNAKTSSETIETFEYDEKGLLQTKNTISKASKYKIINEIKAIELLKGLGVLQTTPTVAMQVKNRAEVNVENKTTEIPQIQFVPFVKENE